MPGLAPPKDTERDTLLAYLEQQRFLVRLSAYGLDDDQARATPAASSLSVGGVIKHLAAVERFWTDVALQRTAPPSDTRTEEYESNFRVGPDETLRDIVDDYERAGAETDTALRGFADLGQAIPVPRRGLVPKDVDAWSVRWLVLHLIEETAHHAGHADIVRETVDGARAHSLMATLENWPASPWVTRWNPVA